MKIKKVPLQCRKKRHYNDTIFQLKQHVSWENGPDSHFGMTQKLKYKIIIAQDIVGVKRKRKLDIVCKRILWKEKNIWKWQEHYLFNGSILQKLWKHKEKEYIRTVWGVGYKFVDVLGEWAPWIFAVWRYGMLIF